MRLLELADGSFILEAISPDCPCYQGTCTHPPGRCCMHGRKPR